MKLTKKEEELEKGKEGKFSREEKKVKKKTGRRKKR